jgi:hypothetical protein
MAIGIAITKVYSQQTPHSPRLGFLSRRGGPPGLASSAGVSRTAWSREREHIVSSLRLKSLKKQEMTIPVRIKVGTDQVEIGEASLLLSDSERILNVIARTVSDFFST